MAKMNFNQKENSVTNKQAHQAPNFNKLHLEAPNRKKNMTRPNMSEKVENNQMGRGRR
jgi:hypothetical protein